MKPIDCRNATFADLLQHIAGDRERVLEAWRAHGPCTTEDLAQRSGISILTLRPRTTELVQLGFVILAGGSKRGGCYRAAEYREVVNRFTGQQQLAQGSPVQGELAIHVPTPTRYY